MYKYMLFDFDGTLIDTNELIIYCLNETSKKYLDKELTNAALHSVLGKYLEEQMRCLSDEYCHEMMQYYKALYKSYQEPMTQEYKGVREMLEGLKELGCSIAIISAKGKSGIEYGLKRFGISSYFDVIISAYDVINNKPHPEPALKALEAMGVKPCEALLIGDSPYDIMCGKNAGIKTVLVDWTIFSKNTLLALGPDYIIKTPFELLEIVRSKQE